jgi:oxygen-dependent protoporphyrinogen oxidase
VVFESSDRAGGKVGSLAERGFLTEDGPNFIGRNMDPVLELAGLRGEVTPASGPRTRWVHRDGRVMKAPGLAFLLSAGVPRALLEPFFARPLQGDVSLREFLSQRFGKRAGTLAALALATGVYAGDPDQLSARDAFSALDTPGSILFGRKKSSDRAPLWNLRRGLGSLPAALATGLHVRWKTPVLSLSPGWSVNGEKFDAVIVAAPSQPAAELLRSFAPRAADALQAFVSAPVTVVHLGFPAAEVPRGFGMLDLGATLHFAGALFPSSLMPHRAPEGFALVTCITGGARNPQHASLPDADLVAAVRADLRATLGIASEPVYTRLVRHAAAIPQVLVGHRDRVARARELLKDFPGLELAGAAYDGVSVPEVSRSGSAAARRLL